MLGPRKNNLTVTRLRSVKPCPEDYYNFNDRTFYLVGTLQYEERGSSQCNYCAFQLIHLHQSLVKGI